MLLFSEQAGPANPESAKTLYDTVARNLNAAPEAEENHTQETADDSTVESGNVTSNNSEDDEQQSDDPQDVDTTSS